MTVARIAIVLAVILIGFLWFQASQPKPEVAQKEFAPLMPSGMESCNAHDMGTVSPEKLRTDSMDRLSAGEQHGYFTLGGAPAAEEP